MTDKTAIQRIQELDRERAELFAKAKEEALHRATQAVEDLNALGLKYRLVEGESAAEVRPPTKSRSQNLRPTERVPLGRRADRLHRSVYSTSRCTATLAGLRTFTHAACGPGRYGEPSRFDTMPSAPSRQAWANTRRPSADMCSLIPGEIVTAMVVKGLIERGHLAPTRPRAGNAARLMTV
jgi:hypothetical protein